MNTKDRSYHIDLAKGIGILLVVFGHHDTALHPYIATFHMPLFFLLSGLFHPCQLDFKSFVKRRARQLLVPYFSFSIVLFLIWLVAGKYLGMASHQEVSVFESFMGIFTAVRIDGLSNIGWGGMMWFLPCLFLVGCLYHLVARCSSKYIILFNVAAVLVAMILMKLIKIRLPWSFITALMALPFYTFGNLCKSYILNRQSSTTCWKDTGIFLLFSMVCYLLGPSKGMINMVSNHYYNLFLFFTGGLAGSLLLINLLKFVKDGSWKWVNYLGMNTLVIYAFHLRAKSVVEVAYPMVFNQAYDESNLLVALCSVIMEVLICIPLVYIINHFFPFCVGKQKKRVSNQK